MFRGLVSPAKEIIVQGTIATLLHLQERLEELTKLLDQFMQSDKSRRFKSKEGNGD